MMQRTIKFFIPIKPQAASRVRVTKFGGYHLKPYAEFLREGIRWLKANKKRLKLWDTEEGHYRVELEVILRAPKKITITWGRGDSDNYGKAYLDIFTQANVFYEDDAQVTELEVTKRYPEAQEEFGCHVKVIKLK